MSFRDWYKTQFAETLSEPLTQSDGIRAREIDRLLDGRNIPLALRDYYRVAGRHRMNSYYDRLLPPNELRSEHAYTIFMDENQNVGHWAFKTEDASKDDPEVYCGNWEDDQLVWYDQGQTLSRFIIASWLETCTGPAPVGYDAIDISWIVGRVITGVSFHEPSLWRFSFGAREHIAAACLWRIVREGRIVVTARDHGHSFGFPAPVDAAGIAMEALSVARVTAAQLREATADIRLTFDTELCLEIISDSCGYESWQLYAPAGRCYVAQGGGQICTWTQGG